MGLKKYMKVMSVSIQNSLEYRFNFFTQLFFSFIPFAVNILIWFSIDGYSKDKYGYTLKEIVSYYFIILIVDNIIQSNMHWQISEDIKTGQINKYLIKTMDYMAYNFFLDLPKRLVFIALGLLPVSAVGLFLRSYLLITINFKILAFFLMSLVLGYLINFFLNFLLSEYSFYFSDVTGLFGSYSVLKNILSGKFFPLNIIPNLLFRFLMATPFQFGGYFPAAILLNKLPQNEIINITLLGCGWVIVLYILCVLLWKSGLKKYSAFGG